jgi:hypothetical protein
MTLAKETVVDVAELKKLLIDQENDNHSCLCSCKEKDTLRALLKLGIQAINTSLMLNMALISELEEHTKILDSVLRIQDLLGSQATIPAASAPPAFP